MIRNQVLKINFSSSFLTMGSFKWKCRAAGATQKPETAHYFWHWDLFPLRKEKGVLEK